MTRLNFKRYFSEKLIYLLVHFFNASLIIIEKLYKLSLRFSLKIFAIFLLFFFRNSHPFLIFFSSFVIISRMIYAVRRSFLETDKNLTCLYKRRNVSTSILFSCIYPKTARVCIYIYVASYRKSLS